MVDAAGAGGCDGVARVGIILNSLRVIQIAPLDLARNVLPASRIWVAGVETTWVMALVVMIFVVLAATVIVARQFED